MLVALIGRNSINKMTLPKNILGNYWLTDNNREKKLINIEGKDGKWQIISNSNVKIIEPTCVKINEDNIVIDWENLKVLDKVILTDYSKYIITFGNTKQCFVLYCLPVYDNNTYHLNINNASKITIGRGLENDIIYKDNFVAKKHATIFFDNGRWIIDNLDNKFGTFVNDNPVTKQGTLLFNGDVVFIMGFKLIIMGNSIFINIPQNKIICNKEIFSINRTKVDIFPSEEKEAELELYSEDEYFSRAPRLTNIIEREKVKIDPPPHVQDKEETPLILVLGSSLSMGAMMIISVINAIDGRMSGTATMKQTIFSIVTAVVMLISMIVFPVLSVKYDRKRKKKYEEKRQKKYKEYLNSKSDTINKIMNRQRDILFENYITAEECAKIILSKGTRLWERKIENYDFLNVRIGVGDIPLNIDIQYPEERFDMEDDNLVEILNDIANNSKTMKSAPVVTSLVEKNISAIISQEQQNAYRFIQNLIIQLITFHSYEDLKLVFLLKEDNFKKWEYVKMLPHVWDNTKQVRFFADNYDDMKEISSYLENELHNRLSEENKDYKSFMPYYLIISDDYKKIENLKVINEMLKIKDNLGFSLLCIANDLTQLPNECEKFINLTSAQEAVIFESEISSTNRQQVTLDDSVTFFFDKICDIICNIPIRYSTSGHNLLPNSYSFLEMYDVGLIEQLNVLERWYRNDATLSLKAPIGIDGAGMPIILDIHEKFHGPHGLIAGSTGSGKSEFIITYILSLSINYHPDDVNFVLIDYKGGGLAGAFQKRDIKLPHLVGTITNVETNDLNRSLESIQSELRRRQVIFNEARNMTDEGTIDIYKYQKLYHQGIVKTPVPHLLIICDEFAELKQQQSEFMQELMSVSRIGRSLGVHLILATQKPAGIVNDQIRSNSKFAVCLKVQDREDSNDVIKRPDAANLKRTGQFYLQVGNDEYLVLGQSAWAGAPYFPSEVMEKRVDNSVQFISNTGTVIKQADDILQKNINSEGEQLTNIVKYLYETAKQEGIKTNNLWLENIPENIYVKNLREKYKAKIQKDYINPIIGEYDDPFNQRQGLVEMDLSNQGNTVIYGSAESGKETLVSTMIYDLITTHNTDEVQLYLLDFGSEALKIYKDVPHVGDVVFINDTEKINRFFYMLQKEINERKQILSDYNGDYDLYLKTSKKTMPMIIVAINNYGAFAENYADKYEDAFLTVTREGVKCGVIFVVTASTYNDMRYRLSHNFKQKIVLQLNNEDDYFNILEKVGKKRPAHIFGRGLVTKEEGIYEFQTAKICEPEQYNVYVKTTIEKLISEGQTKAKNIPVIPDKVLRKDLSKYMKNLASVPIGIAKKDLKVQNYDFKKNFINIITAKNIEDAAQFTINVLEEILELNDVDVKVLDVERITSSKKIDAKSEYNQFISSLEENKSNNILYVIIGIDKFVSEYDNFQNVFDITLKKAEQTDKCNFIFVDNVSKLKSHEFDSWYKNHISKDDAIWVGNGIDNQYLINIISDRREIVNNCGRSYGYVVKQGILTLIKLLEMKEDGEENE